MNIRIPQFPLYIPKSCRTNAETYANVSGKLEKMTGDKSAVRIFNQSTQKGVPKSHNFYIADQGFKELSFETIPFFIPILSRMEYLMIW